MEGFFTKSETSSRKKIKGKSSCFACGLMQKCKSPKMQPIGKNGKSIMIIGSHPTKRDDSKGRPFSSAEGRLLRKVFEEKGIDILKDCVLINAVNCAPPKEREPTGKEIGHCRDVMVLKAIEEHQPKLIFLLGSSAVTSFIGHRWTKDKMGSFDRWRGWTIPDQEFKSWVVPIYSPSYVLANPYDEVFAIWRSDITKGLFTSASIFPISTTPKINTLTDLEKLKELLPEHSLVAFDYETTGLKPQAKGHKIVCVGVAWGWDDVCVFMLPDKEECGPFIEFLQNEKYLKIASNLKYEEAWSMHCLDTSVKGWHFDTMLMSHILDNRPYITSIKFQTYVRLGIIGYDEDVAPYLKSKDGKANAINRVPELLKKPKGKELLLEYCALDALYEWRVAYLQNNEIANNELMENGSEISI